MVHLSQQDPRWAKEHLGKSKITVGRYGCTTTCISMLSDYFECFASPKELAVSQVIGTELLGYTNDGLIIWQTLNLKHMAFAARLRSRNDFEIEKSLKDPRKAVILQVNDGAHWVVAIGKVPLLRNVYWVIDPWDGKKKTTRAFRNITGSAHFNQK